MRQEGGRATMSVGQGDGREGVAERCVFRAPVRCGKAGRAVEVLHRARIGRVRLTLRADDNFAKTRLPPPPLHSNRGLTTKCKRKLRAFILFYIPANHTISFVILRYPSFPWAVYEILTTAGILLPKHTVLCKSVLTEGGTWGLNLPIPSVEFFFICYQFVLHVRGM